MVIAIDGPSGAGKSTLAKRLARDLGFMYLDTGAMYRAVAVKILRRGVELADDQRLRELVAETEIDLQNERDHVRVFLDGEEVTALIRTPEVSQMASKASALKVVRQRMLELQRALGRRGNVVAEGRDIGTVVFPEADVKIYLDASAEERGRRRYEELRASGEDVSLAETVREMQERDQRDSQRALAPLRPAEDAVAIDSSTSPASAVAERVLQIIRAKALQNQKDRSCCS
ncbi:MAG TPA: (d)CMP kinase [Terriglobales bacterium]|nr:(d)CMP kinase [Terriglobales bacterium]